MLLLGILLAASAAAAEGPCSELATIEQLSKVERGSIVALQSLTAQTELLLRNTTPSPACARAIVYRYWKAYWKCQRSYQAAHEKVISTQVDTAETAAMEREIKGVGWHTESSEAGSFLWSDERWLLQRFGALLPQEWRAYFEQQGRQGRLTEDAILQVSWDDLRQRIVFWERFVKQYPAFPLRESLREALDTYVGMWLGGTDNTPVTDKRGVLKRELRTSYELFLHDNTDSTYHAMVLRYYGLLASRKFSPDEKTRDFLKKRKVRSYAGVQPPLY